MIDLSYLKEISGNDQEFIKEMLALYIQTTAAEASNLMDLLAKEDFEAIGHLAHKIKAPIQMLGATELLELIRSLEIYGKEKSHLDELPHIIHQVGILVDQSVTEIKAILVNY